MVPVLAILLAASAVSAVPAPTRVEPGIFLVSKPSIADGPFHRSVVLVLAHGDTGTLGVVVNRDTGVPLAEALPGLDETEGPHELYFGGPVAMDGLLFVFRSDGPREDADPVMADLYYSGDRDVLEVLLEVEKTADELRLYLGHAGWAPGQLEGEILRGDWELARADPPQVFSREPETLWERLSKSGRITARASRSGRPASRSEPGRAP